MQFNPYFVGYALYTHCTETIIYYETHAISPRCVEVNLKEKVMEK